MVKLSIVIVNYNVEFFLEQCLNSVMLAIRDLEVEVFVVDNNSIDGSVAMVKEKFSNVKLIENKENVGFSKANNQALKLAAGTYQLLLNPDTVVEEDTFEKCLAFMDEHPDCGGLGVNMIDGKGNFLPESKRGLPTPKVAFAKIFGLSKLFPGSKTFGRYHLTYLDKDKTHEIEILSGAFMLMRKSALDKVGLLDETFFMYGEDIDLSYRILLGGYKNYYFPETRIIHYKGESTKKSSVNYVFVFYNAMIIFAKKHFGGKDAKLFSFLINLAIYVRAGMAIAWRLLKKFLLPAVDFTLVLLGLHLITNFYQRYFDYLFPKNIVSTGLLVYTGVWIALQLLSGAYDKPIKLIKHITGVLIGTGLILAGYALVSKEYQFSRLIILFGSIYVLFYFLLSRLVLHKTLGGKYHLGESKNRNFAIVGAESEINRVSNLLKHSNKLVQHVFHIGVEEIEKNGFYHGYMNQLNQIIHIHKVDEVIFCAKDLSAQVIIENMIAQTGKNLDFKIAQPETSFLIGSNSIDTKGDLYVMDINRIDKPANKRNKRLVDFFLALLFLLSSPVSMWFFENKKQFLRNLFAVFLGSASFVGYALVNHRSNLSLPKLKKGVLPITLQVEEHLLDDEAIGRLNLIYAKNHSIATDLKVIFSNFNQLDK